MIAKRHRISEVISLYKGLAMMYDQGAHIKSAQISDFVSEKNIRKALASLNIHTILDAGGGTGRWACMLARMGYEVTLMDISRDMLRVAEEKISNEDLSIELVEGDVENTGFPDKHFDLVFSEGGVLSLTPDPQKMMGEFKRITKAGGYLWIDYLNLQGWALLQPDVESKAKLMETDEENIYMGKNEVPFHLFNPRKVRYMLYDNGFLELNEFGNGILTHPMMADDLIPDAVFEALKKNELELSRNYNLIGSAFHVELLAQKIIH
jgi:ubiquinone/menaquinone biosynthesis C-methylase UbiE